MTLCTHPSPIDGGVKRARVDVQIMEKPSRRTLLSDTNVTSMKPDVMTGITGRIVGAPENDTALLLVVQTASEQEDTAT